MTEPVSSKPEIPPDLFSAKMRQRIDGQREWLLKSDPFVFQEQKHLNEGSVERIYWHYGYSVALTDVLRHVETLEIKLSAMTETALETVDHLNAANERIAELEAKVIGLRGGYDHTSQALHDSGLEVAQLRAEVERQAEEMRSMAYTIGHAEEINGYLEAELSHMKQPVSDKEWQEWLQCTADGYTTRKYIDNWLFSRSQGAKEPNES